MERDKVFDYKAGIKGVLAILFLGLAIVSFILAGKDIEAIQNYNDLPSNLTEYVAESKPLTIAFVVFFMLIGFISLCLMVVLPYSIERHYKAQEACIELNKKVNEQSIKIELLSQKVEHFTDIECSFCGHKSPDGTKFCVKCGHNLETKSPKEEKKDE